MVEREIGVSFKSSQSTNKKRAYITPSLPEICQLKDHNIKVDLYSLEKLHSRINHYFKLFKKLHFLKTKAEQKLNHKEIEIQVVEHVKNQMHEKCVKYQDLVFGLFQVLLTLLTSNSLITYSEQHQIRVLS